MKDISSIDRKLIPLYDEAEIALVVNRLAGQLDRDFQNKSPVLVGILKGSFIFLADLVRKMKTPLQGIEFLGLSSYGSGTVSSKSAMVSLGLPLAAIIGRDIIIVEDILDTGITTSTALGYVKECNPASVSVCVLLDKPTRREVPVRADYVGFTVPDKFVVGYGTDLDQSYRQLPGIFVLGDD